MVEARGIASGQRVERSTTVINHSQPAEDGRGPTRSTWRWLNLRAGTGITWTGALVCRVTLLRWQLRQSLDHARASEAIEGHRNRRERRVLVVLPLGCARPCTESKTCRRRCTGTKTLGYPREKSQRRRWGPTSLTLNLGSEASCLTSAHFNCSEGRML